MWFKHASRLGFPKTACWLSLSNLIILFSDDTRSLDHLRRSIWRGNAWLIVNLSHTRLLIDVSKQLLTSIGWCLYNILVLSIIDYVIRLIKTHLQRLLDLGIALNLWHHWLDAELLQTLIRGMVI